MNRKAGFRCGRKSTETKGQQTGSPRERTFREEKQRVIFDRFMQGHETKTKLYGGTGLGLAISKNLTEILGGDIGVESKTGEGATFWFILPRNEVPLKYEAALKTPSSSLRSWDDKKILIAEDDQRQFLRRAEDFEIDPWKIDRAIVRRRMKEKKYSSSL